MGWWYWIGVSAGIGVAVGVLVSGLPLRRTHPALDGLAAAAVGALVGLSVAKAAPGYWSDITASGVGGLCGYVGAAPIVAGALRRGGTAFGLAILVAGVAFLVGAVAFVPAVGFLEAVGLPALALRLRRLQPERYAGLRSLAKD